MARNKNRSVTGHIYIESLSPIVQTDERHKEYWSKHVHLDSQIE